MAKWFAVTIQCALFSGFILIVYVFVAPPKENGTAHLVASFRNSMKENHANVKDNDAQLFNSVTKTSIQSQVSQFSHKRFNSVTNI